MEISKLLLATLMLDINVQKLFLIKYNGPFSTGRRIASNNKTS